MKKLLLIASMLISLASGQSITAKYVSCDTVELKSPFANSYLWDTGQTTRAIQLTATNPNQVIGVTAGVKHYVIYEPMLPALPDPLNVGVQYMGLSAYIFDADYSGGWDIKYIKNGLPLNQVNAYQWQVFTSGVYTIKETRQGCIRKTKIKVTL